MLEDINEKLLIDNLIRNIENNNDSLLATINNIVNLASINTGNKLIQFLRDIETSLYEKELKNIFKESNSNLKKEIKKLISHRKEEQVNHVKSSSENLDGISEDFEVQFKETAEKLGATTQIDTLNILKIKDIDSENKIKEIIEKNYILKVSNDGINEEKFRTKSLKNNMNETFDKINEITERVKQIDYKSFK